MARSRVKSAKQTAADENAAAAAAAKEAKKVRKKAAKKAVKKNGPSSTHRPPLQPTQPTAMGMSDVIMADRDAEIARLRQELADARALNDQINARSQPVNPNSTTHSTTHSATTNDEAADGSIPKVRGRPPLRAAMGLADAKHADHYWSLVTVIHECARAAQMPLDVVWKDIDHAMKGNICNSARSKPEGAYLRRFSNNWAAYALLQQYHKNARANKINRANINTSLGRRILNRASRITPIDGPTPQPSGSRLPSHPDTTDDDTDTGSARVSSHRGHVGNTPGTSTDVDGANGPDGDEEEEDEEEEEDSEEEEESDGDEESDEEESDED